MAKVYIYVVDRDLGFAPNPFHGVCTLATCKSGIRSTASIDDWVFGLGGSRLNAAGKCIFAMKVTQKLTYNEYWLSPEFRDKKPVRNGSKVMMLGDNIYYKNDIGTWTQAHSHHSNSDGSINDFNVAKDTKSAMVLVSRHFYYFGKSAPVVPGNLLTEIGYANGIGHRIFDFQTAKGLVDWVENSYRGSRNLVLADPFDFEHNKAHYSYETNKML